jgi:hypothetical protein
MAMHSRAPLVLSSPIVRELRGVVVDVVSTPSDLGGEASPRNIRRARPAPPGSRAGRHVCDAALRAGRSAVDRLRIGLCKTRAGAGHSRRLPRWHRK